MAAPKFDLESLSQEERLQLLEELWDSLDPDRAAPISPDLAAELDRRSAEAERTRDAGRPWSDIKADLKNRLP